MVLFQPTRQHIALVSRAVASIVVVCIVAASTAVAITVVYARAWQWALALLRLVLPPSVLLLQVLITVGQAIMALPRRSDVHTATTIMPRTTAAYPRLNGSRPFLEGSGLPGLLHPALLRRSISA